MLPMCRQVDTLVKWKLAALDVDGLRNFCHPDRGDGYTEWYRGLSWAELRPHVAFVIQTVRAMWPGGHEPRLGLAHS